MIRGLRVIRFLLLLLVVFVILGMFFAGTFNQGGNPVDFETVSKSNHLVEDVNVAIVVFTPKRLSGNQMARTLDHVNKMNAETGENCRKRCEWTMDSSMASSADAVVFYFFTIGYTLEDLPTEARGPGQIWAMHTREAPPYSWCEMDKLNGVFNWTINYRRDSDIWGPYGRKLPKKIGPSKTILIDNFTLDQWVAEKEGLATKVVSRCKTHSKREVLVEKLKQAGLPVHVYGGCGKELCGRHSDNCSSAWENQIGRKYKFYLAFENSICKDYITEKFWRSLELGMVPVVYGGGNYLDEAPPNSYIDVRWFSSAKELAQYLLKLDKEPEDYKEFFEWRKYYTTVRGGGEWCKFCAALHDRKALITRATKVYEDLDAWYWQRDPHSHEKTACDENPTFFKHA